jgi:hypothetical protein
MILSSGDLAQEEGERTAAYSEALSDRTFSLIHASRKEGRQEARKGVLIRIEK